MDPTYPLFPIFALLGFVVVLIPLPWHLQSWNSGTCFYMMWTSIVCLNQFVNSVVWAGNALNPVPMWCEISIRIMMGGSVGLPASSLCINRRLYHIARAQNVMISRSDKMKAIFIDTLICVVFPLVFIALQYVVQGHRFNIFEDIGCYPALYNTLLTYFTSIMWPIVIGLISAVYCILILHSFSRRRLEFGQFIASNKSLTINRYFRLMALATSDVIFTTPLAIYMLWLNATATPLDPWVSWADTHYKYSRIEQVPAIVWHLDRSTVIGMEFSRWVNPLCALIFFAFFGFAEEARKNYRAVFWRLVKPLGIHPPTPITPSVPGHFKKAESRVESSSLPPYSPPRSSSYSIIRLEEKAKVYLTDTSPQQATFTTAYSHDVHHDIESLSSSYDPSETTLSHDSLKNNSFV